MKPQVNSVDPPENSPPLKRQCLESWVDSDWTLEAVLEDRLLLPIPLVSVLVVGVKDKTKTASLVRKLNDVAPIPGLQHLKRVKSSKCTETGLSSIILLLWEEGVEGGVEDVSRGVRDRLVGLGVDISGLEPEVQMKQVASSSPVTRWQFEQLKMGSGGNADYWPTNFHEDKYMEGLVGGTLPEVWGEKVRQAQRRLWSHHVVQEMVGGLVVDPGTMEVVVAGHGTLNHPLHHTAMNMIDLVARSQGGGAMPHTDSCPTFSYSRLGPSLPASASETTPDPLSTVPTTGPYLLTGYDVYLSREPCHMCAMALLHSRVRRVYVLEPTRDGSLLRDKLHTKQGLNHKYQVFRVKRGREDSSLDGWSWCS